MPRPAESILDVEFGFDDVDGFDGMTTIAESGGREGRSRSLWKLSASPSARESTVHERHEQTRVCHNCRRQLVRVLNSWPMQTILLALILVDIGLTIFQIVMDIVDPDNANEIQWMFALTMTIVSILLVEVRPRRRGAAHAPPPPLHPHSPPGPLFFPPSRCACAFGGWACAPSSRRGSTRST